MAVPMTHETKHSLCIQYLCDPTSYIYITTLQLSMYTKSPTYQILSDSNII